MLMSHMKEESYEQKNTGRAEQPPPTPRFTSAEKQGPFITEHMNTDDEQRANKPEGHSNTAVKQSKEGLPDGDCYDTIASARSLAMGMRKPAMTILNQDQIDEITKTAIELGIDPSILRFNIGHQTGFFDIDRTIRIRGDILPDPSSKYARDRMSIKAVLAHEYYGHYMHHPSSFIAGDWRDEFRASYCGAINAPGLSDQERFDLMKDAYDRAEEAGIHPKWNIEARRIFNAALI